jgi:hypothetical protein
MTGFCDPSFTSAVVDAMDWVPELKHENLVCTHLSSSLRKHRIPARREVTKSKRRFDLEVGNFLLEAKYHFEGDIYPIWQSLQPDSSYTYDPESWNSAPRSIHDELNRRQQSNFLWFVCVRDGQFSEHFKYPRLIADFNSITNTTCLEDSLAVATELIDHDLLRAFRGKLHLEDHQLPTIKGKKSALITRLYILHENEPAQG